MTIKTIFNRNRVVALFLMFITGCIGWYSLILLTNPHNVVPVPSKAQLIGLLFVFIMVILGWIQKCTIILPREN